MSAIPAFWAWWEGASRSISPHEASAGTDQLTKLIAAIHPDLTWHFSAGTDAQHRLTVSAGGVAAVRPVAERWRRAAPATDALWEFRSSQEADPRSLENILEIAGQRVELAQTVFRADSVEEELRVHVGVHHPAFPLLSEDLRSQIAFLVLDWLLGEDDVERWLGHIEPLVDRPAAEVTADGLRELVGSLAALSDPDVWVVAQWTDSEQYPGLATFRRGVRWIDHPTLDRHYMVSASFPAQENGMPTPESLDRLRQFEDELDELLGQRGMLVGHETIRGRRTFHLYIDGEDQNVDESVVTWATERQLAAEAQLDPAWTKVRHLTG